MNLTIKIFLILLIFSLSACSYRDNRTMEIQIDNKFVHLDEVGLFVKFDTLVNNRKVKVEKLFDISGSEKNSLFHLASKGFERKSYKIETLTCYAGQKFSFQLITPNDTLSFKNNSVKSWTSIMPEYKSIHKIIEHYISLPK